MKAYNKENIPLAKVLRKNMTPWNEKSGMIFCETIRCAFKGKKRLETIFSPSVSFADSSLIRGSLRTLAKITKFSL